MHSTGNPIDAEQMLDQPLFDNLDQASIVEITRGGWVVEIKRGSRLLARGDRLEGLYMVLDGRLKLYMRS